MNQEEKKKKQEEEEARAAAQAAEEATTPAEEPAEEPVEPAEEPAIPAAEVAEEPSEPCEPTEEPTEEPAAGEGGLLSATAYRAFTQFLSALTEEDKQTLQAVLARLSGLAEAQAAEAARAERERAIAALEAREGLRDIRARLPQLEGLIARLPWLLALPLSERLTVACYLDRGMQQHTQTAEEKLQAVLADGELMRALAAHGASLRAAHGSMMPPVATGGRAPALVKKPPADLSEAKREAKRFLRAK